MSPRQRITVVTIVKNGAPFIEQTIQSVLSQTYQNIEFLVVDGASTDGTIEIVRRYESQINQWVSEPDKGIADAFNKGSIMASGDAVLYMNAGDEFVERTSLETLVDATPEGVNLRESIIYGDAILVLPSNRFVYSRSDHNTVRYPRNGTFCHQSALIGIEVQRRFPYDTRLRIQMDHDFWLRCLAANVEFYPARQPICRWLVGGLSDDPKNKVEQVLEECLISVLNGRRPRTFGTALGVARRAAIEEGKKRFREVVGDRTFFAVKRMARMISE